jgi:hypothetical protein
MTDKMLDRAGSFLARRTSRRGFLIRTAAVGTALAAGPIRYLVRPAEALAVTPRSPECAGHVCADGFTEFCCSITGGHNTCPHNTFVGGWWTAKPPTSSPICNGKRRYYMDCNSFPGHKVPGGRRCAQDRCTCRARGWNRFSYFNCNTHIQHKGQKSYVVCRKVSCVNPCKIKSVPPDGGPSCKCKRHHDHSTAKHNACCSCGDCA